jgi:hypothetical protein
MKNDMPKLVLAMFIAWTTVALLVVAFWFMGRGCQRSKDGQRTPIPRGNDLSASHESNHNIATSHDQLALVYYSAGTADIALQYDAVHPVR